MSKARRETKCLRCSIFWNGQANSPVQRARDALLAGRGRPRAPRRSAAGTGMSSGNAYGFAPFGRLSSTTPTHLRDHVAGALDHHGVADADVVPRDLVVIVQRGVLHDDAADGDRLELARPA